MDMASLQELPTPALQKLLRDDCTGTHALSMEDILLICQVLAEREPVSAASAQAAWGRFKTHYYPTSVG